MTTKYERLVRFLDEQRAAGVQELEISFADLERVLEAPLPSAARNFRPWWSNSSHTPKPWQIAGYRSRAVHLGRQTVMFHRLPEEFDAGQPAAPADAAAPRMLVFASGTGRMAVHHPGELRKEDFADRRRLRRREAELSGFLRPAAEMYCCQQFTYTQQGVETLRTAFGRESVDLRIVSPGYGILGERDLIAPHNISLTDFARPELHSWADRIGVPKAVRKAMEGYDLVFFLVGQCCLEAMRPPLAAAPGQRLLLLATEHYRRHYAAPGVTVLPTGRMARSSCEVGSIAFKGYLFSRFAQVAAQEGAALLRSVLADESGEAFWQGVQRAQAAG